MSAENAFSENGGHSDWRCLAAFQPGRTPTAVPGPGSRAAGPVLSAVLFRGVGVVRMGEEGLRQVGGRWSRLQVQSAPHPPLQGLQGQDGCCSPPLQGPEGGEEQRNVGVLVHVGVGGGHGVEAASPDPAILASLT